MEIVDFVFRSFFFGFIVWTIFLSLTTREKIHGHRTDEIDRVVIQIAIASGLIHAIFIIGSFIGWEDGLSVNESVRERAFGKYWFGFWMYPVTYFGLTQLLWIRSLRLNRIARVTIALWIFGVMHFEKFVIFMTSVHREYLPGGGGEFPLYILWQIGISWLIGLVVFSVIVMIGMKIRNAVQQKL